MTTATTAIDGTVTENNNLREVDFTKVSHDINGNPRYVFHFLELINEGDNIKAKANKHDHFGITYKYDLALQKAKKIHGRKFHNKQYGGGIVIQSYNIANDNRLINELREVNTNFKKEWDKKDWRHAKRVISHYFASHNHSFHTGGESIKFNPFDYEQINNILGLAYTSSSDYAGLWICNVQLQANDKYSFIGFAINENNEVVGVCKDNNEKELFITL